MAGFDSNQHENGHGEKNPHTDTTAKLPSDFAATVKALLNTPPPVTEILFAKPKRTRKRKVR